MFYLDGLYLTNYRAYNPESGQWLSRDLLGEISGPTLYNYAANNPIVLVDLSGLYPVVVVVFPDGSEYMPSTTVKNSAQGKNFGVPVGTLVPIAVPPGVNPQSLVDSWGDGSMFNGLGEFAWFWRPGGPHDYKLISSRYDAFENFEYGATGAAVGFSLSLLQNAANATHKGWTNNPINTADINSGYRAISEGGKLCVKDYPPK